MKDIATKNEGDPYSSDDFNDGLNNEGRNLVESTGQVLSDADQAQWAKAAADYSAISDFYTDSGAANVYTLTAIGLRNSPPAYVNGMRVRFIPGNSNTGASTINVAGLGAVALELDGAALTGGEVTAGNQTEAWYDSAAAAFQINQGGGSGKGWTELAETSPSGVSSFQVTGIPATAVAIMVVFTDIDFSANSRIYMRVMDNSVVQTTGYFSTSVHRDNTSVPSVGVASDRLHMLRISNVDGTTVQSGQGFLTKNGSTGNWVWHCSARMNDAGVPLNYAVADAVGQSPNIAGVMNGLEFISLSGTFQGGTVTVYYSEAV